MSETSGGTVALRDLGQSGLGRWARLAAVCRLHELRSDGGALVGTAMTELDDMRDWEEADHVH